MKLFKISVTVLLLVIFFPGSSAFADILPSARAADIITKKECIRNAQNTFRAHIKSAQQVHKQHRSSGYSKHTTRQEYKLSRINNKIQRDTAIRNCINNPSHT